MAKKLVYCEQCGGAERDDAPEFLVFHCLAFCSPDCRGDYQAADEARREAKRAVAALATVAEVMRRDKAASKPPKRARAA
jgi:hypothetical protein